MRRRPVNWGFILLALGTIVFALYGLPQLKLWGWIGGVP